MTAPALLSSSLTKYRTAERPNSSIFADIGSNVARSDFSTTVTLSFFTASAAADHLFQSICPAHPVINIIILIKKHNTVIKDFLFIILPPNN
jgi:hypothetical protein